MEQSLICIFFTGVVCASAQTFDLENPKLRSEQPISTKQVPPLSSPKKLENIRSDPEVEEPQHHLQQHHLTKLSIILETLSITSERDSE